MSDKQEPKQSQLIKVLREGVGVIQMILFKELRADLSHRYPEKEDAFVPMLTGALIGEIFNTPNPEDRFVRFRREHRAVIEQELLGLKKNQPDLLPALTDALRIQVLCDNQENQEDASLLHQADQLGILVVDRPLPMPSTFMTLVRGLGEQHGLIIAPVQIDPEDEAQIH